MKRKMILLVVVASLIIVGAMSFVTAAPESKADLGKLLFFDPILSKNNTISCASCHRPQFAFADTSSVSTGVFGRKGKRNTPSAMNLLTGKTFFWDGRAASLEEQALGPIENPDEMDLSIADAITRLTNHKKYNSLFNAIYHETPNPENLANAIASFERTLETSETPFDAWKFGDEAATSGAAKRGFEIFNTRGKCNKCHFGADFTAEEFRNIGLFDGQAFNDSGRAVITANPEDLGKFNTPGLRNVAVTAPYMHNGVFSTLREVIEFYNDPTQVVPNGINRDSILSKPLGLSENDKSDLEAFLRSITDNKFQIH